jgi:hypothetical protein
MKVRFKSASIVRAGQEYQMSCLMLIAPASGDEGARGRKDVTCLIEIKNKQTAEEFLVCLN